jgi:hypothetical protein
MVVLGRPEGQPAVVLWLRELEPCVVANAELPISGCISATISPDGRRLLVVDSGGSASLVTTDPSTAGSLQVATQAPRGKIVASSVVHGTRPALGLMFATLERRGVLSLWGLQRAGPEQARPKVTLLKAIQLGQHGAAMDLHPRLALAVLTTAAGTIQLIDIEVACLGDSRTFAGPEAAGVLFSAVALSAGAHQKMQWSSDGEQLAVLNVTTGQLTWLQLSHTGQHAQERHLATAGATELKGADLFTWVSARKQTRLVVHYGDGRLAVMSCNRAAAIPVTSLHVLAPTVPLAMCCLTCMNTDTESTLLMTGRDGSLCVVRFPCMLNADKLPTNEANINATVVAVAAQVRP